MSDKIKELLSVLGMTEDEQRNLSPTLRSIHWVIAALIAKELSSNGFSKVFDRQTERIKELELILLLMENHFHIDFDEDNVRLLNEIKKDPFEFERNLRGQN